MRVKSSPITAKSVEPSPEALTITTERGSYRIPWEQCSSRLAQADWIERSRLELSPAGYGIHWPLLVEDLAIGPLIKSVNPMTA
jgi:hypothetical protein